MVSLTDKSNGFLYVPSDGGEGLGPAGEGKGQVLGGLEESDILDLVEHRYVPYTRAHVMQMIQLMLSSMVVIPSLIISLSEEEEALSFDPIYMCLR